MGRCNAGICPLIHAAITPVWESCPRMKPGPWTGTAEKDGSMIELVFVSCLSTDPARCQQRSLIFVEASLMTCMVHGQQEIAKWQDSHPREVVREWKCRSALLREAEI